LIVSHFPGLCALWLHVTVFLILANLRPAGFALPDAPVPIAVELVRLTATSPATGSSIFHERTTPAAQPDVTPYDAAIAAPGISLDTERAEESDWRAAENWVTAKQLRSALVLQDPRSAQARAALETVTGLDRREQLCALEAMEQVGVHSQGLRPDRLVPYALKTTVQRGLELYAPAGALRSQGNWYELAYRCLLNEAGDRVMDFQFVLGPPVPETLWDDHGLAAVH
jgi:hypothetical protein